jgi:23S rRNA (uracil1939-C5)-methyltransferase
MAGSKLTDAPVNKNDEVTLDIVGLTQDGEGVGRVDGFALFVQGALPGERVRAKVLKVKKQYGYAKMLELLEASPDRAEAPCPIYRQCGGCHLQHMEYRAQLEWKRQHVIDSLTRIGKLQVAGGGSGAGDGGADGGVVVHPTIGMIDPWRYRNKAQVPIGMARADLDDGAAGSLIGGFYARGSHRIIDMDACVIQHERNDEAVRVVKAIGTRLGIRAYDETTGRGLLRHVVVRTGFATGETMVCLVTNGTRIPRADELVDGIRRALPDVRSIVQNVNTRNTNVIFGDETRVLWGSDVIYDELDGLRFAISARSFFQVNPAQTVALYRKAVEYAGLSGRETVIDAYCGIGTISLFLARRAGKVYGVESVPEAVEDARRNAALNGIDNASFEVGLAEEVIPRWREEGVAADVIVVDPPRKGCDAKLLDTIVRMRPKRVVYVSCNPATLARDLAVLEAGGFRAVEAQPVDMFPHTGHVECVAKLVFQWEAGSW